LDGANRIKDLIRRTKELGMDSIAITDHGVMYGVVDFYKEAVNNGIKPILGCEIYTAKGSRFDKQGAGIRIPVIWCFWQKIIRDTKSDENCIHRFYRRILL